MSLCSRNGCRLPDHFRFQKRSCAAIRRRPAAPAAQQLMATTATHGRRAYDKSDREVLSSLAKHLRFPAKRLLARRSLFCRRDGDSLRPNHKIGKCPALTMIWAQLQSTPAAGQRNASVQNRTGVRGPGTQPLAHRIGLHFGTLVLCCWPTNRELLFVLNGVVPAFLFPRRRIALVVVQTSLIGCFAIATASCTNGKPLATSCRSQHLPRTTSAATPGE
jgi:hypothetical protein